MRLSELDADAREVVKTFANRSARLLITNRIEIKDEETGAVESEEVVELAHDALFKRWKWLKEILKKSGVSAMEATA